MRRPPDRKATCVHCAGGIGLGVCTVLMTVGAIGLVGAGVGASGGMGSMGGSNGNGSAWTAFISFFSTPAGMVLTGAFMLLMLVGFGLSRNVRASLVAAAGSGLLLLGMYAGLPWAFQLTGGVVLVVAYGSVYSVRWARVVHLERRSDHPAA